MVVVVVIRNQFVPCFSANTRAVAVGVLKLSGAGWLVPVSDWRREAANLGKER